MKNLARKIVWHEPSDDTVTRIEISRSITIYGAYTVLNEIYATSDEGAKSSSNTWVVTYTDTTGAKTHWYKIRFYDGTNLVWSDYSDPITAEELLRLCSVAEVKRVLDTVGRWTDDVIFDAITDVDNMIFIECGTPLQSATALIGSINSTVQDKYYVGEENIYRIDRVFYGTASKTELYLDDGYKANNEYGMVKILPVASSGVTLATTDEVEIHYVPRIYNKLSLYRTCKYLLEQLDFTSSGSTSKELATIEKRLETTEKLLSHRVGVQLSSDLKYYDTVYGTNHKTILQDHRKNNYIASTNW